MCSRAIPEYLTKDFFCEALESTFGQKVKIVDLQIKENENVGNYCSHIYRVKIAYAIESEQQLPVQHVNLLVKELYEVLSENSREHFMYATVLPYLNRRLMEHETGSYFAPKIFKSFKTANEVHLMEDLSPSGYIIKNRLVGYNYLEAKAVIEKMAKFHAVSMLYIDEFPDIVNGMKEYFCKSDPNFMVFAEKMVHGNVQFLAKILENCNGFEDIVQKLQRNTGDIFKNKFLAILNKQDAFYRVLAHGDLWIKNILLKTEASTANTDVVFLDFQNCFHGSAGFDIIQLFLTSIELDVLKNKRSELIEFYHQSLTSSLKAFKYAGAVPTLEMVEKEVQRVDYFSYYNIIFNFPQTNLSDELAKSMDFPAFFNDSLMELNRQDMFTNRRVIETVKYELQRLNALGVLD